MAISLVPTVCKEITLTRCKDPKISDCTNQVYDDRPPQPCGESTNSGGAGVTSTRHSLGVTPGTVVINYNMLSVPDKMDVYYDGVLVATTGGYVSGTGSVSFEYDATGPDWCRVVVTGPSGTVWFYTLECPV